MIFAERAAAFRVEALALEILLAHRAVEALAVVVVVQGLHPAITSLDWESAREAFRGKQLVPVSFAVGQSLLQKERAIAEEFAAIGTVEAFRVEVLSNRVQAVALDFVVALVAHGRDEFLEAILAVELSLLLHEADVLKGTSALGVDANEMIRAPNLAQSSDEGPSDV